MFIPGEMSLTPGGNRFLDLRQLTDSHLLLALGLGGLSLQLVADGSDVGGQSFCVPALVLVLGSVAAPFGPPTHPFVARLKRCRSAGHGPGAASPTVPNHARGRRGHVCSWTYLA